MRPTVASTVALLMAAAPSTPGLAGTYTGCFVLQTMPGAQEGHCSCDDTNPLTAPDCNGILVFRDPYDTCVRSGAGQAGRTECTMTSREVGRVYPCHVHWDIGRIAQCIPLAPACAVVCEECIEQLILSGGWPGPACSLCQSCLQSYFACGPCDVAYCDKSNGDYVPILGLVGTLSGDSCTGE